MTARFAGFPPEALTFYEGLEADNSKAYWQANKAVFEASVRGPMLQLLEELAPAFGEFHVFRPNRDIRFSKDKSPYKLGIGAVAEAEGSSSHYLELSAKGLRVGGGYYAMASDQLTRFRAAVDDDARGGEVSRICRGLQGKGYEIGAIGELKTAPRGFPKDHPRIELLRRKGLIAMRLFPPEPWLHTAKARSRVTTAWTSMAPLTEWLDANVGPSELPPEDAGRW